MHKGLFRRNKCFSRKETAIHINLIKGHLNDPAACWINVLQTVEDFGFQLEKANHCGA